MVCNIPAQGEFKHPTRLVLVSWLLVGEGSGPAASLFLDSHRQQICGPQRELESTVIPYS